MKKLLYLLVSLPLIVLGQNKTVLSTDRIFPQAGKVEAVEKALAAHAQKFHKGDQKWRIYSIQTGPDAGGYHVVEGPMTWDALDKRGDLGPEHQSDYNINIAPLLIDRGTSSYSVYRADLSSVQLTDYSDKIAITHVFPKPGYSEEIEETLKKSKKMWDAGNQSVAVYESSSSGAPQMVLVVRYKEGLKERESNFRKPAKERFDAANGDGSWVSFQQTLKTGLDHSWSEILFYEPKLSSK
ncbi:MAG: hypothetical protein JWQ09_2605 [Segetibacter sp.]|nr:hypothetical protein [Segetibacter sp.]